MKPKTTRTTKKKSDQLSSDELRKVINDHASLILNLDPDLDIDSKEMRARKKEVEDIAVQEFLNQFLNRILPTSDRRVFVAVFETRKVL